MEYPYLQGQQCLENCECHNGVPFDQCECICPSWCGDAEYQICPKCGYNGLGIHDNRKGFQKHQNQLNPNSPHNLICGNCSEAF